MDGLKLVKKTARKIEMTVEKGELKLQVWGVLTTQ